MKIRIPERLSDIKVEDWLKYRQVVKMEDFDDQVDDLALVTIFCHLTIDMARQIPSTDFKEVVTQIRSVLKQEPRFVQRFVLEGKEFGFIPSLEEISQGELIDLDLFLAEEETYIDAMAVMYRPVEGKIPSWVKSLFSKQRRASYEYYSKFLNMYNIEDYKSSHVKRNRELMLKTNLEVMFGSQVFFYRLGKDLLRSARSSLESQVATMEPQMKEALMQNGVGLNQFIQLLEEINLDLTTLLD